MLQITIHHSHCITARLSKTGHNCSFFSKIPGKMHCSDIRILFRYLFDLIPCSILSSVFYQDQFIGNSFMIQDLLQRPADFCSHQLFIICRQNYRQTAHFFCLPLSLFFPERLLYVMIRIKTPSPATVSTIPGIRYDVQ